MVPLGTPSVSSISGQLRTQHSYPIIPTNIVVILYFQPYNVSM